MVKASGRGAASALTAAAAAKPCFASSHCHGRQMGRARWTSCPASQRGLRIEVRARHADHEFESYGHALGYADRLEGRGGGGRRRACTRRWSGSPSSTRGKRGPWSSATSQGVGRGGRGRDGDLAGDRQTGVADRARLAGARSTPGRVNRRPGRVPEEFNDLPLPETACRHPPPIHATGPTRCVHPLSEGPTRHTGCGRLCR